MDKIIIKGAKFEVNIGVTTEERQTKQPLLVDIILLQDISTAAVTDAIEKTVNYSQVCKCVAAILTKEYRLIETVAEIVAREILDTFPVNKVKVCIKKPQALRIADYTAVEIVRER